MFVKGAPEGIVDRCTKMRVGKETIPLTSAMKQQIIEQVTAYGTGMSKIYINIIKLTFNCKL